MSNKYFKTELVNTTLDATELQRLGKIYYGFNSLVDSMVSQTFRMIELKSFPYGEYIAIKNTFHTTIAVLESLATSFENLDEKEILEKIQFVNSLFAKTDSGKKVDNNSFYRTKELSTNNCSKPQVKQTKHPEIYHNLNKQAVKTEHHKVLRFLLFWVKFPTKCCFCFFDKDNTPHKSRLEG